MRIMRKTQRLFLIVLAFILFPCASLAINFNPKSMKGIIQTYGFVLGQEYSLSRIESEFPDLSENVKMARAQFDFSFPNIKTKLETQLKISMGEKLFRETATNFRTTIRENLGHQQITREASENFLEKVRSRSKGEIESPVLEYLLAVKYTANPVDEFFDGYRQRYQTDGTGKSQGIKLSLQVPRSWTAKEGERPHIVKKWVSENGTGLEIILLDIRDAQGYDPGKKEMEAFVRSGDVKKEVPEGAEYIDAGTFTLESRTGYWVQMAMPIERAEMKLYQNGLMYQFFFQGKAVGLMCQAGGPETEKARVNEAFRRIRPLCQQVLNSLVLLQAY